MNINELLQSTYSIFVSLSLFPTKFIDLFCSGLVLLYFCISSFPLAFFILYLSFLSDSFPAIPTYLIRSVRRDLVDSFMKISYEEIDESLDLFQQNISGALV